jgi:ADP-heptose:LPS heptosyltransferase
LLKEVPKFLIIRFSSIGDIVLTTPVVRCLKTQVYNAEVHYLTKPGFAGILATNPYIDKLHILDKPILEKALELKQLGFDYVIDLHNNLRTRIFKSILDLPSFSFEKLNVEKSILVHTKLNTLPPVHIVDRYLNTLQSFDVTNDEMGLDYFLPAGFLFNPTIQLPEHFIAFAIGAQHATKRLPNEKIISICRQVKQPIVLLGGKEDAANGETIAAQSGSHVIHLCGKLSLHESAYVVSQSDKVITHDTGLMHIAAAFKKEIFSVWGNTVPEFGMTPYYGNKNIRQSLFEIKNLYCRPCSKIGFTECPQKHFKCMLLQDTTAIANGCNEVSPALSH